jgi:large subunit ribosomal protein L24
MLKIKRDDEVVVITGKDKGKRGKVVRVLSNGRLLVAGVNLVKKHQRGNPQAGVQGGIIEKEAGIQASNVAIWNAKSGRADRIGFRFEDGKKVRFFKSDNTALDA